MIGAPPQSARRRPNGHVPPLQAGERLSRAEFERRYDATPDLKKAELIEGVVYMPPPVSDGFHSAPHFDLIGWLFQYRAATPGVHGGDNGSLRLDLDNMPQPDAYLRIDEACGGQSRIDADSYVQGAPEFVGEIAASSTSHDLHEKMHVYRRSGVREYLVWRVPEKAIDWFVLVESQYQRLPLSKGLYKSTAFPGLWLDAPAMIARDMRRVIQALNKGLKSAAHAKFVKQLCGRQKHA